MQSNTLQIQIMPLPNELLYQIVGYAVTNSLHGVWWTHRKAKSITQELQVVSDLLLSSHQLRDVTLQVLSDVLRLSPRRPREHVFTSILRIRTESASLVLPVSTSAGSLGAVYILLNYVQEQLNTDLLVQSTTADLQVVCERYAYALKTQLDKVRPSVLAETVAPLVGEYVESLQTIARSSSELKKCQKDLAQEQPGCLSAEENERYTSVLLRFRDLFVRCVQRKARRSKREDAESVLWTWVSKRGLPRFRGLVALLERRVAQSPYLSGDDLFHQFQKTGCWAITGVV